MTEMPGMTKSAPTKNTSLGRGIREGDVVTFKEEQSDGQWLTRTVRLAPKCNVRAMPMELGPDTPVYKALLGKHEGTTVKSVRKMKISQFASGSS